MSGQGRTPGPDAAVPGASRLTGHSDPMKDGKEVEEERLFRQMYELLMKEDGASLPPCPSLDGIKDESEIPAAVTRKTEEKMAKLKSRIYGTGCGEKGTNIWVLKGLKIEDSEEEEEEDDDDEEEEESEKSEEELEEEEWNKPANPAMKKWDYFEHMKTLKAPGRVVDSYPPHVTTKKQRREWEKENARQMEINWARRQQKMEEERQKKRLGNLRTELDEADDE